MPICRHPEYHEDRLDPESSNPSSFEKIKPQSKDNWVWTFWNFGFLNHQRHRFSDNENIFRARIWSLQLEPVILSYFSSDSDQSAPLYHPFDAVTLNSWKISVRSGDRYVGCFDWFRGASIKGISHSKVCTTNYLQTDSQKESYFSDEVRAAQTFRWQVWQANQC